jgi:hypothetical protein
MSKAIAVVGSAGIDGETFEQFFAAPKVFKSGSVGFYSNGKVVINGERYTSMHMYVKIGSKPVEEEKPVKKAKGK